MPAFLAHGIVHQRDLPAIAGIRATLGESPVDMLPLGDMAAVLSRLDGEATALAQAFASADDMARLALEHHRVLAEIAARIDVVPMRMRALLPDKESLAGSIHANAADFRQLLSALGGQVELSVRFRAPGPLANPAAAEAAASEGGRGYLRWRKAVKEGQRGNQMRLEEAVARVEAGFAPLILRACDIVVPGDARPLLRRDRALLVARNTLDTLAERLPPLATTLESQGISVVVSGPWAPFHFLEPEGPSHG